MLRRKPLLLGVAAIVSGALVSTSTPSSSAVPLSAHLTRPAVGADGAGFPGAEVGVGDVERRGPRLAPLAAARAAVAALRPSQVSYNRFGTVGTLTAAGASLASGVRGATPAQKARSFLSAHSGLVGLSPAQVDDLLVSSSGPMEGSGGRGSVVLLRQRMAGIPLVDGGMIAVTLRDSAVVAVSSSAAAASTLGSLSSLTPRISPAAAVLAAARDAGVTTLRLQDIRTSTKRDAAGFQLLSAKGLSSVQRTRLAVLATTDRGARLVWETDVVDLGVRTLGVMSFVDALDGTVLVRRDAVDTLAAGTRATAATRSVGLPLARTAAAAAPGGNVFSGETTATACSPKIVMDVPAGSASLAVEIGYVLATNDIVLKVFRNGATVASADTGLSPEAATIALTPPAVATDVFEVQGCPLPDSINPAQSAPFNFTGFYVTSDTALPAVGDIPLPDGVVSDGSLGGPATFRAFSSNPQLPTNVAKSPDDRDKICNAKVTDTGPKLVGCTDFTYFKASPYPYDVEATTGLPTLATIGNNAVTTNAQESNTTTPGAPGTPVVSPTRDYAPSFTDAWHTSNCDPQTVLDPTQNNADVQAAIVNLFTGHNRTHDFAYLLGLNEARGALQTNNFSKGGVQGDPELGNAQNAAATQTVITPGDDNVPGGLPVTGRNNANQLTLQDGVPGNTNQYLFQPVVGFSGPCTDGDLDASIFLHEYTHAISGRLVGGPVDGITGEQGGAMGESWSDLVALEYLNAFGLAGSRGEDPFAEGAYATGNPSRGIRDYNLRTNPLTYGEYGFDVTGPEVHADGEIWNGTQIAVRNALVAKYNATASSTNKALEAACALGFDAAGQPHSTFAGCPGDRRWVTYLFAAMYMQANGDPSMVDQKNMMLAADKAITGGVDQEVIATTFAKRGLGAGASSKTNEDTDPTPDFAAPAPFAGDNAQVTFALVNADTGAPVQGAVYVGHYQARATPIATTLGGKSPDAKATFVAGTYDVVVQAKAYGLQRFKATFTAGSTVTKTFRLMPNLLSRNRGASAAGTGGVRLGEVIDDDEATDGGFDGLADRTPVKGRTITVDLPGTAPVTVGSIAVSALHHPVATTQTEGQPADFQGRLLGVHDFSVQASTDGKTYTTVYTSPTGAKDLFTVSDPRATAPDLNLRTVGLSRPVKATSLRLTLLNNTCGGVESFQGEQENDPFSISDCLASTTANANQYQVVVAEFQAFSGGALGTVPATTPAGPKAPPRSTAPRPRATGTLATTGPRGVLPVGGLLLLGLAGAAAYRQRRVR